MSKFLFCPSSYFDLSRELFGKVKFELEYTKNGLEGTQNRRRNVLHT